MLVPSHGWVPPMAWQQRKQFPPPEGVGGVSEYLEGKLRNGDGRRAGAPFAGGACHGDRYTRGLCTGGWAQLASSTH